ncbi:MAG: hypothetical protein PW792_15825 [Acidobacteriaceae bacterium]|nr:hypothetical protein [Acidobacteriaceae bacterium]
MSSSWFGSASSKIVSAAVVGCVSMALSGCAFQGDGSAAGNGSGVTQALQPGHVGGSLIGGQNPISGAKIQLYQIGVGSGSSYTASAQPLLSQSVTTNSGGAFDITGLYNCTPGSYLYITAAGGDPGLNTGVNNSSTLMASVGLCENLPTYGFISINEETTVAMAYAFAQFGRTSLFGTALAGQSAAAATPSINFATSSTNMQGLKTASDMYNLLVEPHSGISPGTNGNGALNSPLTVSGTGSVGATGAVAEFWQVNTIADILAACVNSAGLAGSSDTTSNCGVLFNNVTAYGGTAPADTAQAALDFALYPALAATNVTNLYNIIPPTAPFIPYVTTAASIYDFSIAIQMKPVIPGTSTELLYMPTWLSPDGNGNLWITQQTTAGTYPATVLELTDAGVPIRAGQATGATAANYIISNYGVSGSAVTIGGQYQKNSSGTVLTSTLGKFQGSIDTNNNLWFSDRQNTNVVKVNGSGATGSGVAYNGGNFGDTGGSGATGYALPTDSGPTITFVDGNDTVWTNLTPYIANVGQTGKAGNCSAPPTSLSVMQGTINTGTLGFVNGDPANGLVYGSVYYSQSPATIVVDPNKTDYTTSGGVNTPITGGPFLWEEGSSNLLNVMLNGGTHPGCAAAVNTVGSPAGGTTQLAGKAASATAGDTAYPLGASLQDLAFDSNGYLWVARAGTIDPSNSTVPVALTKTLPQYGTAFTPAQMVASTTDFQYFYTAGMSSTYQPRSISIDGDGNAWFIINGSHGLGELSNSGAALSPVPASGEPGFRGSVCTNCKFRGEAASTYTRATNGYGGLKPIFDVAGNVLTVGGGSAAAFIEVVVGAAGPTVQPMSLAIKNGKIGQRP